MPDSDFILSLKEISNRYDSDSSNIFSHGGKTEVLRGVSFDIRRGEIFGLVGESGCGKSTLGRAIAGLVECGGEILLDGEKVSKKRTKEQRRKVQIVFQDPLGSLNPTKKIGWILEEPLRIHHVGDKASRLARVDEILGLVGLGPEFRDRYPHQLSGGQLQRVSIGGALMLEPKLIIADEPVSALDVSVQSQILNLLSDIHRRLSVSYLFISHNLNVIYYLCDRVAVMYLGRIVELADVGDLYDSPLHPYTRALLSAVPEIGDDPGGQAEIRGEPSSGGEKGRGCAFYSRCPISRGECQSEEPALIELRGKSGAPHWVRCRLTG